MGAVGPRGGGFLGAGGRGWFLVVESLLDSLGFLKVIVSKVRVKLKSFFVDIYILILKLESVVD